MIRRQAGAELCAVCDTDAAALVAARADFADVACFGELADMLAAPLRLDVVCICTPNGYHAEQSIAALRASVHVVCEKPMALRRVDCEAVIFEALQRSRHVFCVMQNRYSPPAQWLKSMIEQERLGRILMVEINCYWNRDERYYRPNGQPHAWKGTQGLDGGTLFTQFSHFIDVLYWLFGDIDQITARFANHTHADYLPFEDSGTVLFRLQRDGAQGVLTYSTSVFERNMESSLTIIGTQGSIKVGGQYMNEVEYCHVKDYVFEPLPAAAPANDYGHYKGSAANHHFVIQNVVDTLLQRCQISTNALEGLKVVDIIERIYAAG